MSITISRIYLPFPIEVVNKSILRLDSSSPGALDIIGDLDSVGLLLESVLEELNPALNVGGLVVDSDLDPSIGEGEMVPTHQEPNGLQERDHHGPNQERARGKRREVKASKGRRRVERVQGIKDGPDNLSIARLLSLDEPVQLGIVPHEMPDLLHQIIQLQLCMGQVRRV